MIKRILTFAVIIAVGLAIYFYQNGVPESLPASTQTGQVVNSEKVLSGSKEKKEISLTAPLKVSKEWLSGNPNEIILSSNGIIGFTNQERSEQSLTPLTVNGKLNAGAKTKLDDMFRQQYFEHTSPDGMTIDDLAGNAGYDYILIGENLAQGDFKDDQALVSAWMASPKHRANILNSRYTEIGVAAGRGVLNGQEVWLAVTHFGRGSDLCPDINLSLKTAIDQNKARLDTISKELSLNNGGAAVFLAYFKGFNKIKEYNKLIKQTEIDINQYNNQVEEFNNCIQN